MVGSDANVRKADNITKYYIYDVAMKYRARPTAYVVSKDAAGIDKALATIAKHGIDYYELAGGTTLELKQYSGSASSATLGAAQDVTFENGAYIIPVDGYKAYLISTLFEPECYDSGEEINTLAQAGYLAATDIYRSEESFIAAKLGLDGTYVEIDTNGKTVENAVIDGVTYENVDTDGEKCYIVRAEDVAVVNYTDGTSETYYYSSVLGDIDGDRVVTVFDALCILRSAVDGDFIANGDVNGDGKISLLDVIRVMKNMVE